MLSKSVCRFAAIALTFAGCGGCPWTHLSELEIAPATSCLELSFVNADGGTDCVDPQLTGTNTCSNALTIPARFTSTGADQVFAPGAAIAVDVPLDASTRSSSQSGNSFAIPATLGDQMIMLTWHTSGGTGG